VGVNTAAPTAFVRQVVRPGGPDVEPRLDPAACAFELRCGPSPIHRFGVFACEPIPPRRRVIEYTGERIGRAEVRRRSVRPRLYVFWTSARRALDGAIGGSGAEFVNHGCEPNLVARVRKGRVFFVSLRRIEAGEELLVDYQLIHAPTTVCWCGAERCRGRLNAR
jgi:uncharacterized protein